MVLPFSSEPQTQIRTNRSEFKTTTIIWPAVRADFIPTPASTTALLLVVTLQKILSKDITIYQAHAQGVMVMARQLE